MDIDPNHSPWQIDLQSYSNSRYKTEFCRNMDELGACRYSFKCQFAHDMEEMRPKYTHHPHYRTEKCRTYHVAGFCRFGTRCAFIHNGSGRLQNENVIYVGSWEDGYYTTDGYFKNTIEDTDGYYKNNNGDTNGYFRNKRSNRQWTGASTRKAFHMENNKRKYNQQGRKQWYNHPKDGILNNVNHRNQEHSNNNYNVAYEEYGCSVKQLAGGNKSGDNTNYNYEEMSSSTQGTNSNNLVEQKIKDVGKWTSSLTQTLATKPSSAETWRTLKVGQSGNLPFSLERTQVVSNRMELVFNKATDDEQNGRHLYNRLFL
uniref:Zinc finger protein 36, C3H1 type-like 2-A n=1 Tax=Cacopsylla melanoneura TaxID=428564 RepID=A0A8D9BYH6_9HEMI